MYSCGPLHTDEQSLDDRLEPMYSSSVPIQDVAWKTCRKRWTIEMGGERGTWRSLLAAWHDDDEDIYIYIYIYIYKVKLAIYIYIYIYTYTCFFSRGELIRDVLLCPEDLPRAMNDREEWRERVRDIRATSATRWWWYICSLF